MLSSPHHQFILTVSFPLIFSRARASILLLISSSPGHSRFPIGLYRSSAVFLLDSLSLFLPDWSGSKNISGRREIINT
ncbi:hypothetical protein E2C01_082787 [Portunus trituberculatus]|uniref:Uncharacterized protein n=1 Tax=Portunus trituberculatus TaxID=210409 RepID=A0A5B7J2U0_PORTR|nr:hypothetical protein [Portunus trituberculatus]